MNYYGSKELAESFRTVRKNTLAAANDIPEDKYGICPAEGCKTVEKMLTHIALSYRFQHSMHAGEKRTSFEGVDFPAMMAEMGVEEAKPRTKSQVIDLLTKEGEIWATFLEGVSEDFLSEPFQLPGGTKSRFEMIMSVKEHEMHHRGQVMLVQRLLGFVPHLTREREEHMAQAQAATAS